MSKLKSQTVSNQALCNDTSIQQQNHQQVKQENQYNLSSTDCKRQKSFLGDRFVTQLKKNFSIIQENQMESQDIASAQMALEMLYKQQILEQEPIFESDSMQFINQSGFQYNQQNNFDIHNSKIYNSILIDHKYFTISETLSNYYGKYVRKIPKVPFKVLDAPQLQDDFYLNLIDWSNQNSLSVALNSCVYLWNAQSSKVTKLLDLHNDSVTSVAWSLRGPHLAVGTKTGEVQIWDAIKLQRVRTYKGHIARVGTLCFSDNVLSSGSRDKLILQRDLRLKGNYFSETVSPQIRSLWFEMVT
ncbi:unnamed protein product (macronuclear) [Paramecium tetraurelia]|uniref:Uncharacterized protein n=1 Tax=Paramecium tetraurelia TaxID=5888 RepID=A0DJ95_PARTE|nr:uncharacterized protein GSPATT00039525001 [Paramecium tetraurelia]CAK83112.1 unnamed protein product [Paramecium tetraurelia]|eukprot:XP_001450509.1 hypothetical protein (macronuclear) [Paramecium tetraurelia strain d4-2]